MGPEYFGALAGILGRRRGPIIHLPNTVGCLCYAAGMSNAARGQGIRYRRVRRRWENDHGVRFMTRVQIEERRMSVAEEPTAATPEYSDQSPGILSAEQRGAFGP